MRRHLSNVTEAKDILDRVLAGAEPLLPAHGRDRIGKKDPPYDETYVMPENLFLPPELTSNPQFTRPGSALSAGQGAVRSARPRRGSLSRASMPIRTPLRSAPRPRAWLVLGDPKYKDAIEHAFTLLTTSSSLPRVDGDRTRPSSHPIAASSTTRSPRRSTTSRRPAAPMPPPNLRAT